MASTGQEHPPQDMSHQVGQGLGSFTGLKASKTSLKASKGTQHRFLKQGGCSHVSGEGWVRSPSPAGARYRVHEPGATTRRRPRLSGTGPDQKPSCPPACQLHRALGGRQGSTSGCINRGFPLPEIFRGGSRLHFWTQNGKSPLFGIQIPEPLSQDGDFSSRTRSSHEAGGRGTHRAEMEPGWWLPCRRDGELGGPDGDGVEEPHRIIQKVWGWKGSLWVI